MLAVRVSAETPNAILGACKGITCKRNLGHINQIPHGLFSGSASFDNILTFCLTKNYKDDKMLKELNSECLVFKKRDIASRS